MTGTIAGSAFGNKRVEEGLEVVFLPGEAVWFAFFAVVVES